MLKIVLCDDNPSFLSTLEPIVQEACAKQLPNPNDYEIGPAFENGKEVIEYVKSHPVDVLLLDIDMPDVSGFEVARVLCRDHPSVKIVFMSAYDNFVYSAFDFYPFAYLRKPHIPTEFPKVLSRILEKMNEAGRRLCVTTTNGVTTVEVNAITHIESRGNYLVLHMVSGTEHTLRGTLTDFEKEVSESNFFRVHSAFLINMEHVEKLLDNRQLLISNRAVPIAQRRIQDFKKAYMRYIRRSLGT